MYGAAKEFDRKGLLTLVLDQFKLDRDGYHGPSHWARVRVHALEIARIRSADLLVVELFAFLHDSQRHSEGTDSQHGQRAADFAASLNHSHFSLAANQLDKLCHAIRHHSGGIVHTDVTIQSCWDGDRLDLGRVGTKPHKDYLSPEGAKLIPKAYRRSLERKKSDLAIEALVE
jgi:uncharacterized protein